MFVKVINKYGSKSNQQGRLAHGRTFSLHSERYNIDYDNVKH